MFRPSAPDQQIMPQQVTPQQITTQHYAGLTPPLRYSIPAQQQQAPNFVYLPQHQQHLLPSAQSFVQGTLPGQLPGQLPPQVQLPIGVQVPGQNVTTGITSAPLASSPHTPRHPSALGAYGQSSHLLGTAQSVPTQASPSSTMDLVTPTKSGASETVQASPGEDYFVLTLSSKDFYSPQVQDFLKSSRAVESPSPKKGENQVEPDKPVPVESAEITVKSKGTKTRKQLQMSPNEPFIPKPVKDIKKEPEDVEEEDVVFVDQEGDASPAIPSQPPPKMTEEEANGKRLTDGLVRIFIISK